MYMFDKIKPYFYPITFLLSVIGMTGSLYFSDFLQYAPCVLCWYQRITLYPIVAISLVSMWRNDWKAYTYILPLSIIGMLIAAYHTFIYYAVNWGFRPDLVIPCQQGVSCTSNYLELFGFVSIPLMSFLAHLAITILMVLAWKVDTKKTA